MYHHTPLLFLAIVLVFQAVWAGSALEVIEDDSAKAVSRSKPVTAFPPVRKDKEKSPRTTTIDTLPEPIQTSTQPSEQEEEIDPELVEFVTAYTNGTLSKTDLKSEILDRYRVKYNFGSNQEALAVIRDKIEQRKLKNARSHDVRIPPQLSDELKKRSDVLRQKIIPESNHPPKPSANTYQQLIQTGKLPADSVRDKSPEAHRNGLDNSVHTEDNAVVISE